MSIFKNFLIALDQALNTLIRIDGEWGLPDETLSARAYRLRKVAPQYEIWIDRIFFWNDAHCEASYRSELLRKHLPGEYRSGIRGQRSGINTDRF
ncbi:hypothetical protein AGMMS50256_27590 [Betaproteobacteria bacterium]|nr:hypothetical protein AGMMS50256_27590 [Betaproteobacteria bacterium]